MLSKKPEQSNISVVPSSLIKKTRVRYHRIKFQSHYEPLDLEILLTDIRLDAIQGIINVIVAGLLLLAVSSALTKQTNDVATADFCALNNDKGAE